MAQAPSAVLRTSLGSLGLLAPLPGFLGAAEVLVVGEEMSTLGRRMLPLTLEGGILSGRSSAWVPLLVGVPILTLSALRLVGALGLLSGWQGASRLLLAAALPALLVDLACFASPLGVPWVAFDLLLPIALWRRRS